MQITAKYASTCPNCGQGIALGSQVEWERDKKAVHVSCPERSSGLRLIGSQPGPSRVMNAPANTLEETVTKLKTLCHVEDVKGPYALVHASPAGLARVVTELGLSVHPSRKGGDWYAVRIAKGANLGLVPPPVARSADILGRPDCPVPVPARQAAPVPQGLVRMVLKGADYLARETRVKRTNMDVRRFEVRKDGELVQEPYVVSFQSNGGHQCSCPDWIYRRRECKHIQGCVAVFERAVQTDLAIAN